MNTLVFGISLAAVLSSTSLLIVVLRVSPLLAPRQALMAFFLSTFMTTSTLATLLFLAIWRYFPQHGWDTGRLISISLRQGIFLGSAISITLLFHILGLLTWWITLLIFGVFVLIELALDH